MKYSVSWMRTALALIALAPALVPGLSGGYVFAQEALAQEASAKDTPVQEAPVEGTPAAEEAPPLVFPKIPYSATALTLEGETVSLEAYKGKLVFLTVWRTDCKACLFEIPTLNRLQKEFSSEDFTVLGVSVDRGKDEFVKKVVELREMNYPIWMGLDQPLMKYTPAQYLPTLYAIGPGGEVLGVMEGAFPSYEYALEVLKEARARVAKSGETE